MKYINLFKKTGKSKRQEKFEEKKKEANIFWNQSLKNEIIDHLKKHEGEHIDDLPNFRFGRLSSDVCKIELGSLISAWLGDNGFYNGVESIQYDSDINSNNLSRNIVRGMWVRFYLPDY